MSGYVGAQTEAKVLLGHGISGCRLLLTHNTTNMHRSTGSISDVSQAMMTALLNTDHLVSKAVISVIIAID